MVGVSGAGSTGEPGLNSSDTVVIAVTAGNDKSARLLGMLTLILVSAKLVARLLVSP